MDHSSCMVTLAAGFGEPKKNSLSMLQKTPKMYSDSGFRHGTLEAESGRSSKVESCEQNKPFMAEV